MTSPVILRIILGENNAQKLTLQHGVPCSLEELIEEIKTQCNLREEIRLQFMDTDFNEFINLTSTTEVQNKSTLKVVKLYESTTALSASPTLCDTDTQSPSTSSVRLSSELSPTFSLEAMCSSSPGLASNAKSSWPTTFVVPRFSYDAEIRLGQGNVAHRTNGSLLNPDPKLKSGILDGLAEEIIKFKVYLSDSEFSEVAEALIRQHPCLKEPGSVTGCSGWKVSLKYKMANCRTKLRNLGCSEVTINSMKHKPEGTTNPAFGVKKARKAEVNFCPSYPPGETVDNLETIRVSILSEVKKKNNEQILHRLMDRTFALRRQEVIQGSPLIADFKNRWPALFQENEVCAEFARLTTVPLISKFFQKLDEHTPNLLRVFSQRGGVLGRKIRKLLVPMSQCDLIDVKRECILKALSVYLNEDPEKLIKEYMDVDFASAQNAFEETVLGIFVIRSECCEVTDLPADVGVILEGVTVLEDLRNVGNAIALLIGLIYSLNLSYPKELRHTFEVIQKLFLGLDGNKLSPKVQALKTKLFTDSLF